MRKKKYVYIAVLIGCLLAGCNQANSGAGVTSTPAPTATLAPTETPTPTEAPTMTPTPAKVREEGETSRISVEPVEGLSDDFLFGADMSMLIAQENSGVVYYNELGEPQDALLTLARNGVNLIRVRVWNNPYDEDGRGYGGGNCDTANAIAIGKRATAHGMSLMVDYHYSDFWADPGKQMCPKDWKGMSIEEKADALYTYTKESLTEILSAGVDVSMVQIGNETTSGMAGEKNWKNITTLMNSGSKAVREVAAEFGTDIQVVVHFTNPEKGQYTTYAKSLNTYGVDYDVFASSYYSFWHGTLDNLKKVLGNIAATYGKKVMVAELSYAYTYEDGDGHGNTIKQGAWGTFDYEVSAQGQADAVRDCVATLAELGDSAIGVCYWEPAWIPVPDTGELTRAELWEKYGSGWASSYASGYDPDDAGKYYGGSAWDNQAWFDFNGMPLPSIQTYLKIKGEVDGRE